MHATLDLLDAQLVPEHTCFVEVFGGAAGVLVNKDPTTSHPTRRAA